MDSELFGKLFTIQKLNILIYWLDKLQNADIGFFVKFLQAEKWIFRYVEVYHTLQLFSVRWCCVALCLPVKQKENI